ncbi:MAG: hypothetical protein WD595_00970 [Waddliaceae bacterium]
MTAAFLQISRPTYLNQVTNDHIKGVVLYSKNAGAINQLTPDHLYVQHQSKRILVQKIEEIQNERRFKFISSLVLCLTGVLLRENQVAYPLIVTAASFFIYTQVNSQKKLGVLKTRLFILDRMEKDKGLASDDDYFPRIECLTFQILCRLKRNKQRRLKDMITKLSEAGFTIPTYDLQKRIQFLWALSWLKQKTMVNTDYHIVKSYVNDLQRALV